jgi:SAM-dependent methyltransferase
MVAAAMSADVVDLRDFYASPLGDAARRLISRQIGEMWPDATGQRVLGLGYATPYLRLWRGQAERVIAMMPATQGVLAWPAGAPNLVGLVDGAELPLPDLSIDRVLLVHALEHAEQLRPFLREIWRVMAGGGRLLIVAPNRRGLWARFDRTPFGHGLPYTAGQLSRVLRDHLFTPLETRAALFSPPFASKLWRRSSAAWEALGEGWLDRFAGVVLTEAGKQLYAPTVVRVPERRREVTAPSQPIGAGRGSVSRADGSR